MIFLHFIKHLESNHQQLWGQWSEREKDGLEQKRCPIKKKFGPILNAIFNFFGIIVWYPKDDPHQK
jgi:hypothetical protein